MLKAFLERRRLKKILARYVSPNIAHQLADGSFRQDAPAYIGRSIEVVFIAISALDTLSYSDRAKSITEIASQHGGIVHSLFPVVIVAFGCIHAAPSDSRLPFVASVQARFSDAAAIVHGAITASVGSFGGDRFCQFGFWWPGALDALRQLATLSAGQTHELLIERNV